MRFKKVMEEILPLKFKLQIAQEQVKQLTAQKEEQSEEITKLKQQLAISKMSEKLLQQQIKALQAESQTIVDEEITKLNQ